MRSDRGKASGNGFVEAMLPIHQKKMGDVTTCMKTFVRA